MTSFDFSNLEATAEEQARPISTGRHTFKVESATWKPTKSGKPMMTLVCVCQDDGPDKNKKAWHRIVYTDEGFGAMRCVQETKAFGITPASLGGLGPTEIESLFASKTFSAVVEHEDFKGQPQARLGELSGGAGTSAAAGGEAPPPVAPPAEAPPAVGVAAETPPPAPAPADAPPAAPFAE